MEVLADEQTLQAVLGRNMDLGIDNEALDFQQLEDYISGDNMCLPDEGIQAIAYSNGRQMDNCGPSDIKLNGHLRIQPHLQNGPNTTASAMYCSVPRMNFEHYMRQTPLPDSPPDSGSEPYSPHDGQNQPHMDGKHSIGNGMTPLPQHPPMYPQNHTGMNMPLKLPTSYMNEPPKLNHLPQQQQLPPSTIHQVSPPLNHPVLQSPYGMGPMNMNNPAHKKRKYTDSPNNTINGNMMNNMNSLLSIKQEPPGPNFPGGYALPDCSEDDFAYDLDPAGSFMDSSYQVIKWQLYQSNKWTPLTDSELKDLPQPTFRVDADKGFNFSPSDESFVCQKKNHFQVTVHIGMHGHAKYVRTTEGVKKIDNFCLHFKGIKMESPTQSIKVEQSQSDRSKKPFNPIRVDLAVDQVTKFTVGRLHFSETTSNNMRKKGKPNPDQRYFMLVVSLQAHCGHTDYTVAASNCERIIVRASNPGQFDSDVDVLWQKGHTQESAYHVGKVGVNTDHPEEALTVHGNIRLTGHLMQPSDIRAKENFKEINSKEQKENVEKIKIYKYNYSEDFAESANLPHNYREDTGVLAQEIREVLPDAVQETGDVVLPNGLTIDKFLVVDKDRIFMENVGAVKELCKLTDNLEIRIDELETMNTKLLKLKRYDSLKSTASFKSCSSISTVSSAQPKKSSSSKHHHHHSSSKHSCSRSTPPPPPQNNMCSNRFIQFTIVTLVLVMAFCIVAITVLYILERHSEPNQQPSLQATHSHFTDPPGQSAQTTIHSQRVLVPSNIPKHTGTTGRPPASKTPAAPVIPTTTIPTRLHPIIPPYPPCIHNCEETCCKPIQEDQPVIIINNDAITNISKYNVTNPNHTMRYSPQTQKPTSYNTIVVDLPDNGASPKVINNNDNLNPTYRVINNNNQNVVYFRAKRSAENTGFNAVIKIKELNYTIGDEYCGTETCTVSNKTYVAELSSYFGLQPVTLQFTLKSEGQVMMCKNDLIDSCDRSNTESNTATLSKTGQVTEWSVKIGSYSKTQMKFRVSQDNNPNLCTLNPAEADSLRFIEYNLYFQRRACNSNEEE